MAAHYSLLLPRKGCGVRQGDTALTPPRPSQRRNGMKKELLVTRSAGRAFRRMAFALGVCAVLGVSLAAKAPAQAANLLANPGFDIVGPLGPVTTFTGPGASPSAAAAWRVYHPFTGTTRTNLMPTPW